MNRQLESRLVSRRRLVVPVPSCPPSKHRKRHGLTRRSNQRFSSKRARSIDVARQHLAAVPVTKVNHRIKRNMRCSDATEGTFQISGALDTDLRSVGLRRSGRVMRSYREIRVGHPHCRSTIGLGTGSRGFCCHSETTSRRPGSPKPKIDIGVQEVYEGHIDICLPDFCLSARQTRP